MTARYLIGDVHERQAELEPGSYDLVITSPPFLALRSYLPDGHPDKDREIGSEPTPAAFLDVMLELTAGWGRLLAPHGSIAVEIGDTYSGTGGAGGDWSDSPATSLARVKGGGTGGPPRRQSNTDGWPMAKSLAMIPELYAASLAYGRNLLTGQPSPAGRWRVRNFKPWIRSNPPVGALGDKERPATSYVTVATRATDRYFDLDAVRTPFAHPDHNERNHARGGPTSGTKGPNLDRGDLGAGNFPSNTAGAPPLDWWHHVDAILDDELDTRAGKPSANRRTARHVGTRQNDTPSGQRDGNWSTLPISDEAGGGTVGARGVHLRRRLEQAGILTTLDALDVSPKGYKGAHYAVWPPELVKLLVQEMCPRRVCTTCGQPSRRITETEQIQTRRTNGRKHVGSGALTENLTRRTDAAVTTTGWSDCGHGNTWRPGRILDPFAGSGTTLAVAVGLGHNADGIDLDQRNAILALDRVGMFLDIAWPAPDHTLPTLPRGGGDYRPWPTDQQAEHVLTVIARALHTGTRSRPTAPRRPKGKAADVMPGQTDLFTDTDPQLTVYDYPEVVA